ncbi:hypothetical protein CVT25_013076 [Psilocybe cyanescens]|uniref:Uncharacterized protein n=1 Tax=Psilocybe cyanescens TaxID=93625 RepID=A0A409XWN7_PSICY|nr:hypothetical protein CVT25_013076 [Psilocybe cyanescens]
MVTSSVGVWIIATDIPPSEQQICRRVYIHFFTKDVIASAVQIPGGTFCVPRTQNHRFARFWIPALSYETLLCAMALYTALKNFRSTGSFMTRSQNLVQVLIRDSVFYFLIISATYIFCLVWWTHAPDNALLTIIGIAGIGGSPHWLLDRNVIGVCEPYSVPPSNSCIGENSSVSRISTCTTKLIRQSVVLGVSSTFSRYNNDDTYIATRSKL